MITAYIPLLFRGAVITLIFWFVTGSLSVIIGTLLGILGCQSLATKVCRSFIWIYTFIAKGIPAYVQILIAYFVIPPLLGLSIPGYLAATIALVFCSSGYVTEIVRAGINAIPQGQWDACFVLGYPLKDTLQRIILPQVFRNILPALVGELEQLLKSTSLLATIGITELTRTGMNIISRELNPIAIYLIIAAIYLLFSACIHILIFYMHKRSHV